MMILDIQKKKCFNWLLPFEPPSLDVKQTFDISGVVNIYKYQPLECNNLELSIHAINLKIFAMLKKLTSDKGGKEKDL